MMTLSEAVDEMARRMTKAGDELHGASLILEGTSFPWPPEIEANWQRMVRRTERRWAAWKRLAAARNREQAGQAVQS